MTESTTDSERRSVCIAIVEDHQLLSASLRAALLADGFSVVVPALSDRGAVAAELCRNEPAVALLDLDLGAIGSGEDFLPLLVDLGTRVLFVSGNTDEAVVGRCLHRGAWGWVSKSASFDVLLGSVLRAVAGEPAIEASERDRLMRAWREQRTATEEALAPMQRLSRREAAVLGMLQDGKSVERIASESFVAAATVRTQVRAILAKLEVNSQLEAVAKASRAGWRPPTDD
jgi:DNA-binding NarL/FixJ family response regulator